jgi:hypothetical protein
MARNTLDTLVDEMVTRTMREGGFLGEVKVRDARFLKDGTVSAKVTARYGYGTCRYRVRIGKDRKIRVTKVGEVTLHRA